jgi:hypothetical protein
MVSRASAWHHLVMMMLLMAGAFAYPEYRQELPGIPAVQGTPWQGVGHNSPSGGGSRNQFGKVSGSHVSKDKATASCL